MPVLALCIAAFLFEAQACAGRQRAELGLRVRVADVRRLRPLHVVDHSSTRTGAREPGGTRAQGGGARARRDAEELAGAPADHGGRRGRGPGRSEDEAAAPGPAVRTRAGTRSAERPGPGAGLCAGRVPGRRWTWRGGTYNLPGHARRGCDADRSRFPIEPSGRRKTGNDMTGMGHGLQANNPTITAAFRSSLDHQFLVIVILAAVLAVAWNVIRTLHYRRCGRRRLRWTPRPATRGPIRSPPARRVLRITFGLLWLFDGLLQVQDSMPVGLPGQVITPAAGSSPGWVQHLVNVGTTIWSRPPGHRGVGHRVDPGRHRGVPPGAPRGVLVAGRRRGERGLGARGLGVRRGLRRHLRARGQLDVRAPGGRRVLRRGRAS